jgi:hypothetical protein
MVLVLLFLGDVGVMADIAPYQPSPAKTIASNIAETSSIAAEMLRMTQRPLES